MTTTTTMMMMKEEEMEVQLRRDAKRTKNEEEEGMDAKREMKGGEFCFPCHCIVMSLDASAVSRCFCGLPVVLPSCHSFIVVVVLLRTISESLHVLLIYLLSLSVALLVFLIFIEISSFCCVLVCLFVHGVSS